MGKEYLAIIEGSFTKKLKHNAFIGSRYRGSQKVTISEKERKRFLYAELTAQLELKLTDKISLVRVRTAYGRRHQVRAQLAALGFPLLGDTLYGAKKKTSTLSNKLPKFVLHAEKITLNSVALRELASNYLAPPPNYLENLKTMLKE